MIGARAEIRELFFDRAAVHNAIDEATRAVLMRFGAYTRRTAQQSIRSRKKASAPGQPPSSHTGILKHNIFFAFDPANKSVVVGPVYLTGVNTGSTPEGGKTVPSVLEFGGTVTREHYLKPIKYKVGDFGHIRLGGKANKTGGVRQLGSKYGTRNLIAARVKLKTQAMVDRANRIEEQLVELNLYQFGNEKSYTVRIGPRPFMAPAFQKELGVLDALWQSAG